MFIAAYLLARWLWVPLLVSWFTAPGVRARWWLAFPIAVAIAATIWEALMPVQMNIRLDLMFVIPLLGFAEALAGVALAATLFARRKRRAAVPSSLVTAAVLCLAAPLLLYIGWTVSSIEAESSYQEHVEGHRYRFEASFHDDATQRMVFGDLQGGRWAGYYKADPPSLAFAHLVVNSAGDFFIFAPDFYERRGRGDAGAGDTAIFSGRITDAVHQQAAMTLTDLGGGRVHFHYQQYGNVNELDFVKKDPPRFARAASPSDKVRFKGVFSTRSGRGGGVQVAQLWLWEGDGRMWGKYFRQGFTAGAESPVVATRFATLKCASSDCSSMVLTRKDDWPITLTWLSPDRLREGREGDYSSMIYERGEVIPGFLYHLAPLATVEENRKWLRSMHHAPSWKATAP